MTYFDSFPFAQRPANNTYSFIHRTVFFYIALNILISFWFANTNINQNVNEMDKMYLNKYNEIYAV